MWCKKAWGAGSRGGGAGPRGGESLSVCKSSPGAHGEGPSLSIYLLLGDRKCSIPTCHPAESHRDSRTLETSCFAAALAPASSPHPHLTGSLQPARLRLAGHFLSPEPCGFHAVAAWKHLATEETEALGSEETFPRLYTGWYTGSGQPRGISDLQSCLSRPDPTSGPVHTACWGRSLASGYWACSVCACRGSYHAINIVIPSLK